MQKYYPSNPPLSRKEGPRKENRGIEGTSAVATHDTVFHQKLHCRHPTTTRHEHSDPYQGVNHNKDLESPEDRAIRQNFIDTDN